MTAHVMVIEPKAFEEALDIVEHLRARKSVILNLHLLDTSQSQRVVDFLSGATHAIDGHQQRIGDGVFIFTPSNVDITTDKVLSTGFSTEGYWGNAPTVRY
jgi:cell division inhibitor SepF